MGINRRIISISAFLFIFCLGSQAQVDEYKNRNTVVEDNLINNLGNIRGPNYPTIIVNKPPTSWTEYNKGSNSRLAIFLTDTTSSWLGLVHSFKSLGIPFKITTDINEAVDHDVMMVYPSITNRNISYTEYKALIEYPRNGGTLIATNVLSASLFNTFGIDTVSQSDKDLHIHFHPENSILVSDFTHPNELKLRLANPRFYDKFFAGTTSYLNTEYRPIATYDSGLAAITQKIYPNGAAYAIGIDIGFFMLRSHNGLDLENARSYMNGYDPGGDLFIRFIKNIYKNNSSSPVTIGMVPFNKQVSIMITHDVDTQDAIPRSLLFAKKEFDLGIRATYYIQTKYVEDYSGPAFYSLENLRYIEGLKSMGMEVGCHTVSHPVALDSVNLGSGREMYPSYRPFIFNYYSNSNVTLLGELRVSKFLLDELIMNQNTLSFRSGHLSFPKLLWDALNGTGYKYSSTQSANNCYTHLPYKTMQGRDFTTEIELFEFPVTMDDEYGIFNDETMNIARGPQQKELWERFPEAVELTNNLSKYGGVVVFLIHPNITDKKLSFEEDYIKAFKGKAWFGTIGDFGQWWEARDNIELDVSNDGNVLTIDLSIPKKIRGFNIDVPVGYNLVGVSPNTYDTRLSDGNLLFTEVQGNVRIVYSR